jgi:hypothetical protein
MDKQTPTQLKVTKQIKVGETIECEGNFFYIDKQELKYGQMKKKKKYLKKILTYGEVELVD